MRLEHYPLVNFRISEKTKERMRSHKESTGLSWNMYFNYLLNEIENGERLHKSEDDGSSE